MDRLLGKELCVLAWAVEQMEMEKIPVAVRNWLALRPEERWWLFGMTAMSTGGVMDAGKGWQDTHTSVDGHDVWTNTAGDLTVTIKHDDAENAKNVIVATHNS